VGVGDEELGGEPGQVEREAVTVGDAPLSSGQVRADTGDPVVSAHRGSPSMLSGRVPVMPTGRRPASVTGLRAGRDEAMISTSAPPISVIASMIAAVAASATVNVWAW